MSTKSVHNTIPTVEVYLQAIAPSCMTDPDPYLAAYLLPPDVTTCGALNQQPPAPA